MEQALELNSLRKTLFLVKLPVISEYCIRPDIKKKL